MLRSHMLLLASACFVGVASPASLAHAQQGSAVDEIVVLGKSYGVEVGAKALAPLREVPNTITVVDQQRIEDQNLFTLEDMIRRTTGVSATGGDSEIADFRSRGFVIDNFLVDGVPNNGFTGEIPDLFVYDRVEILRGPAGLFSGSGNPAGSINLVRKRPLPEFAANGLLSAGSWNNYRGQLDVSSPLTDGIATRAGVAYQDRDQFYDVARQRRLTAFANLDFKLGETTTLTFGGHIDRFRGRIFSGLPGADGGGTVDVPRSTYAAADFNRSRYTTKAAFAELRQELGGNWVARLSGQYGKSYTSLFTSYAFSFTGLTPTDGDAALLASALTRDQDYLTADLNAVGSVSLFGREHDIIVGADYQRKSRLETFTDRALLGTLDLYDPDYGAFPTPVLPVTFITDTTTRQYGAYGQARLSLADPLRLVLGARLSWYVQDVDTLLPAAPTTRYRKNGRFVPYAGLVFDVASGLTAYASFADTFTPQTGTTLTGEAPRPATGKQYEAGLKQELFEGRLLASFALFQIDQTGIAQADPVNPGFVVSSGKIRSRGVELEANGTLAPGWTINGGYAYTKLRYIDDTQNLAAANERQQPRHSVKLWSIYRPPEGPLTRWSIGGGLTWQSRTAAELTQIGFGGEASQKGYVLVDARIGYEVTDALELAATVNNLFDKKYYERVNGIQFGNFYGPPRNFMLTARAKF